MIIAETSRLKAMTGDSHEETGVGKLRQAIRIFLEAAPPRYDDTRRATSQLNKVTREEVARIVQPVLNDRIMRRMAHATYQEKKDVAYWVNTELRELGLAILCPNTGRATLLKASPGHNSEAGMFRLEYVDADRSRHQSFASIRIPDLELVPNDSILPRARPRSHRSR